MLEGPWSSSASSTLQRTSRIGWGICAALAFVCALALMFLSGCAHKWEVLKHSANALQDSIGAFEAWDHDAKRAEIGKCPPRDMPCAVAALERHKARREPVVRVVEEAGPVLAEAAKAIDSAQRGDTSALVARILDATKALALALAKVQP